MFKKIWKAVSGQKTIIGLVLWKTGEVLHEPVLILVGQLITGGGVAHKAVKLTKEISNGRAS